VGSGKLYRQRLEMSVGDHVAPKPQFDQEHGGQSTKFQDQHTNSEFALVSNSKVGHTALQRDQRSAPVQSVVNHIRQAVGDTPSKTRFLSSQRQKPPVIVKGVSFMRQSPELGSQEPAEADRREREVSPELLMPNKMPPPPSHSILQTIAVRHSAQHRPIDTSKPLKQQNKSGPELLIDHDQGPIPSVGYPGKSSYESDGMITSDEEELPAGSKITTGLELTQGSQLNRKRSREVDLDYDHDVLKTMSFETLYKEPFDSIHLDHAPKPIEVQGLEKDLTRNLERLDKMSEIDQKTMLRNQNDEDWAETGTWFIQKFQEDLKQLMDARLERRKLSMRYEHEVRKRHKAVERCTTGVNEELNGLRTRGTDLIKPRPGSRPQTPLK
jgi:hypothetical protein